MRVATADLVPTDANLLPAYDSFSALEAACSDFGEQVNGREHRTTRRVPAEALVEERRRLHPLPASGFTACFGTTRRVEANLPIIHFDGGEYSVPHELRTEVVWVRHHGDEVVITAAGPAGAAEVARHLVTTPGNPRHVGEHFGPAPETPLSRTPRPSSDAESAFLAIGPGASLWLTEAGAQGVSRVRAKMADAVTLAVLHGASALDRALAEAAMLGRFAEEDLASILAHQASRTDGDHRRAGEDASLQPGTASWSAFGR